MTWKLRPRTTRRAAALALPPAGLVSLHDAHDSGSETDLATDTGWTPTLHGPLDRAGKTGAGRAG